MQGLARKLVAHYEPRAAAMYLQNYNICPESGPDATVESAGPFGDLSDTHMSWCNHHNILYQPRWGRALWAGLLRLARSLSTILIIALLCTVVVPIAASPPVFAQCTADSECCQWGQLLGR
jgi:hypothetical protein